MTLGFHYLQMANILNYKNNQYQGVIFTMTLNYKIMKKISLHLPFLLIALFAFVGCKSDKYVFEDLGEPVKSFYTFTTGKLLIKQTITFTNASENADSYLWDFGDGTTSTEKNPTKVYTEGKAYTVKLKAVGTTGTGNYAKTLVVIDPDAVVLSDKFLYYIEDGSKVVIKKVSVNVGSTPELVLDISDKSGLGLACDTINKKIYFTETKSTNGKVWQVNMDGTGLKTIATGFTNPNAIVVDHKSQKLYWVNTNGTISKSNLDGTDLVGEFIKIAGADFRSLAVNSKSGDVYFVDYEKEVLYRAKADGTGIVEVDSKAYGFSIFVDEVNDKLYYDSRRKFGIMKANLDGTNSVLFVSTGATTNYRVYGMAIDYEQEKLYYSQYYTDNIMRINLDGTKKEEVASDIDTPRGIFLK